MSNPEAGRSIDELQPADRAASGWYSVLGCLGLVLAGFILYWNLPSLPEADAAETVVESRPVIRWRHNPIFSLAWSPDSRRLAASCFGPVVRVWDRRNGTVSSHEGGTEQPRFALGWSEDGQRLMVSGLDLPIESWDILEQQPDQVAPVVRPRDRTASIEALIRTSSARPIRLWGGSHRRFGLSDNQSDLAISIAFAPDGRTFATACAGGRLELREPVSGDLRRKIEVDRRGITAVSFSPDGRTIASSGPGPVRLWEVATGREVGRLGSERSGSTTHCFSPDGSKLAAATWEGSIAIWDVASGTQVFRLKGHEAQILTLAWAPDGKTLASGGYDSTVRVWDLDAPVLRTAGR